MLATVGTPAEGMTATVGTPAAAMTPKHRWNASNSNEASNYSTPVTVEMPRTIGTPSMAGSPTKKHQGRQPQEGGPLQHHQNIMT
jgi:hypothetical protein